MEAIDLKCKNELQLINMEHDRIDVDVSGKLDCLKCLWNRLIWKQNICDFVKCYEMLSRALMTEWLSLVGD